MAPTKIADTETPVPKTLDQVSLELTAARQSMIDNMRDHYKGMKRVRVKVRNDGDVPVQVNGYTFIIQCNVDVDVPEEIANILREADYI